MKITVKHPANFVWLRNVKPPVVFEVNRIAYDDTAYVKMYTLLDVLGWDAPKNLWNQDYFFLKGEYEVIEEDLVTNPLIMQ